MEDFIRPITRKEPNRVILHIGTNDVRSTQSAQQIKDNIINLADQIEGNSPNTKISISALLYRKEGDLWAKAQEINKSLRRFCNNRGWGFLDNKNINSSCLNRSGLHLNSKGVSELSKNFSVHIMNN